MAELTLTIDFYMAVSRLLENFEVDIELKPLALDRADVRRKGRHSRRRHEA